MDTDKLYEVVKEKAAYTIPAVLVNGNAVQERKSNSETRTASSGPITVILSIICLQ